MRVIKNNEVINDDWMLLSEGATFPAEGNLIVSLATWNNEPNLLLQRPGQHGVLLASHERPEEIQRLETVALIAVEFPKFADGRGYSHARVLRDRLDYRGELRAVGNVLRDQLFYMRRCGFDSFAVQDGKDIEGAVAAFREFSVTYQGAADTPQPLYRRLSR